MKIRKRSTTLYDACCNNGDVTALWTWLSQRSTFSSMEIFIDGSIKINTVADGNFRLNQNDYVYVKDTALGTLDRVSAQNFSDTWEIAPS